MMTKKAEILSLKIRDLILKEVGEDNFGDTKTHVDIFMAMFDRLLGAGEVLMSFANDYNLDEAKDAIFDINTSYDLGEFWRIVDRLSDEKEMRMNPKLHITQ